jgi:pimeloyl-ACP methyl ester carboxylesterase
VHWDQPGGGATYAKNMESGPGALTFERFTRDGIAVTEFVRTYLHVSKLVLMGISWGTELGLMMLKQRPDLFSAYVGTAQVVSGSRGSKIGYELALKAARERNESAAIADLERVGPPPYKTLEDYFIRQKYTNPPGLPPSLAEKAAIEETSKLLSSPPAKDAQYIARDLPTSDGLKVFMETQRAIFEESSRFEARDLGLRYTVPIFVFQGPNDLNAPATLAREFMEEIQAPVKKYVEIPGAGHMTIAFHAELLGLLNEYVRPLVARTAH